MFRLLCFVYFVIYINIFCFIAYVLFAGLVWLCDLVVAERGDVVCNYCLILYLVFDLKTLLLYLGSDLLYYLSLVIVYRFCRITRFSCGGFVEVCLLMLYVFGFWVVFGFSFGLLCIVLFLLCSTLRIWLYLFLLCCVMGD